MNKLYNLNMDRIKDKYNILFYNKYLLLLNIINSILNEECSSEESYILIDL